MIKKILIPATIIVIIGIAILSFYLWNTKVVSTITLDINPSIEINLTGNGKVKSVIALNDDAKEIINNDLKNISLEEAINNITEKVIENGYADNDEVVILIYSDDNNSVSNATKLIEQSFSKNQVKTEIIKIDKISKEDKELAEKYNITPAKASYINKVLDENKNVKEESLIEKSISELKETKETGKYCDTGYFLEGDFCYKEIKKEKADIGDVCPAHSVYSNGKCYEAIIPNIGKEYCRDNLKLVNGECIGNETRDAIGKCEGSTSIAGTICEEEVYVGEAVEICRLSTTDWLIDHKCYGPKPTINGGCVNGDRLMNGKCIDMNTYYASDWKCPNGKFTDELNKKCYERKTTKPKSYYCEGDDEKLDGNKCVKEIIEPSMEERICSNGYILEDNQCINYNKEVSMVQGYKCDKENTKLKNNYCITYDIIDAKN